MSCSALSIPSRSASPDRPGELRHPPARVWLVLLGLVLVCTGSQPSWAEPVAQNSDHNSAHNSAQDASPDTSAMIEAGSATIHTLIEGQGRPVVLLPALGRGVADFGDLSVRLVAAGFQVVRPQPRGIGASTGPTTDLTLHDLGNDIAAVIRALDNGPATLVGHALGSRIARVVATDHPQLVSGLVLLAAEEAQPTPPEVLHARLMSYDPSLPLGVRRQLIQKAFFAAGNDPGGWQDGWHQKATRTQLNANLATTARAWSGAGSAPILLLQGREDKIAPPENARRFKQRHGSRVTLIEIGRAGHALLPEQPQAIAEAIVHFLRR